MCVQAQKGWLHQLAELVPEPQVLLFFFLFPSFVLFLRRERAGYTSMRTWCQICFSFPLFLFFFFIFKVVAGGHENVFK
jgi:hypothetical protein